MRFDYTKGKPIRYVVSIYYQQVDDHAYFSAYDEARQYFDKTEKLPKGTRLQLYDWGKGTIVEKKKV